MPEQLPGWLLRARASGRPAVRADTAARVQRGDLRVASGPSADSDARSRIVFVLHVDERQRIASVALVTNEVDLATSADRVLRPDSTGLPYAVMVEPDVVGPVWGRQLGPLLARVE